MEDKLLSFLKALADPTRLTILGLLAQESRSVDELAALLKLSAPTVSHHLARLHKVQLVAAKAEQYYNIYALQSEVFIQAAARLTPEYLATLVQTNTDVDYDAYIDQVLARWVKENRLQGLPTQVQHRRIVLQWLVEKFELDQRYTPRQVDDVLAHWCSLQDPHSLDITTVSRTLVDAQLLTRTREGHWYWRTDSPLAQALENFTPDLLPLADTSNIHIPFKLSPLLALVRIAIRLKQGQLYSPTEVDAIIRQYNNGVEGEAAKTRSALVREQLLQKQEDGRYTRPLLAADHPAMIKLRAEAMGRQSPNIISSVPMP